MPEKHIGVLDNGGRVLVCGVRGDNLTADWTSDPRVLVWSGDKESHKDIPTNVKAIVYTRFLDHKVTGELNKVARQRRLVIFPMLQTHQVKEKLAMLGVGAIKDEKTREVQSPKSVAKNLEVAKRGVTKALVEELVDFKVSPSEEARRVLKIAEERGIQTTMSALLQRILSVRRAKGLTAAVGSVQAKKSREMQLVTTLSDMIAGLELLREGIQQLEAENRELKDRQEAIEKALGRSPS